MAYFVRFLRTLLVVTLVLGIQPLARGWNGNGHMKIALIAYEVLLELEEEAVIAAVVETLKKHEKFDDSFLERMPPEVASATRTVKDKWLFAHAAILPDIARGYSGDDRKKFHHGSWHYVNYPIVIDGSESFFDDGYPANLENEWESGMRSEKMNIIQALSKTKFRLQQRLESKADKAAYMCWLFHLVGDSHQPLHASALFSERIFPKGDKGGNLTAIRGKRNLHSLWDGSAGSTTRLSTLSSDVRSLLASADLKQSGESASRELDPSAWIDESFTIASEKAYSTEIVNAIADHEQIALASNSVGDGEVVSIDLSEPDEYVAIMKETATERIVQAGYRLAHTLISLDLVAND